MNCQALGRKPERPACTLWSGKKFYSIIFSLCCFFTLSACDSDNDATGDVEPVPEPVQTLPGEEGAGESNENSGGLASDGDTRIQIADIFSQSNEASGTALNDDEAQEGTEIVLRLVAALAEDNRFATAQETRKLTRFTRSLKSTAVAQIDILGIGDAIQAIVDASLQGDVDGILQGVQDLVNAILNPAPGNNSLTANVQGIFSSTRNAAGLGLTDAQTDRGSLSMLKLIQAAKDDDQETIAEESAVLLALVDTASVNDEVEAKVNAIGDAIQAIVVASINADVSAILEGVQALVDAVLFDPRSTSMASSVMALFSDMQDGAGEGMTPSEVEKGQQLVMNLVQAAESGNRARMALESARLTAFSTQAKGINAADVGAIGDAIQDIVAAAMDADVLAILDAVQDLVAAILD